MRVTSGCHWLDARCEPVEPEPVRTGGGKVRLANSPARRNLRVRNETLHICSGIIVGQYGFGGCACIDSLCPDYFASEWDQDRLLRRLLKKNAIAICSLKLGMCFPG